MRAGGEGAASRRRRPLARRLVTLASLPLGAVVAVVGVTAYGSGTGGRSDGEQTGVKTATATVERKTLVDRDEVDGTLGYGESRQLVNRAQGTVTKMAAEGSVVERNGVLYQVDNRSVRLLYGDVPAFRRLAEGVSDGPDVQQLEANLKELGFAKGLISKPDAKWDSATTAAVKRWEKSVGVDQDGVVEDGEVVFLPGAARIADHKAEAGSGAQPGSAILAVTGTNREVSIDLDTRKQRLARQGAKVEIELPNGSVMKGTITSVGTVAKSDDDGDDDSGGGGSGGGDGSDSKATLPVTVALDDPAAAGSLDGAPVKVRLVKSSKEGVLAVPVNALLALAEGGSGVEVAGATPRRLIRVETGLFSEGYVEVSGEGLSEGLKVVVPL